MALIAELHVQSNDLNQTEEAHYLSPSVTRNHPGNTSFLKRLGFIVTVIIPIVKLYYSTKIKSNTRNTFGNSITAKRLGLKSTWQRGFPKLALIQWADTGHGVSGQMSKII